MPNGIQIYVNNYFTLPKQIQLKKRCKKKVNHNFVNRKGEKFFAPT